jgi:regulator of replication initiation timing
MQGINAEPLTLEKLQKRVEKLVKANKSLKKDKRNLKRRLTTSQNKSNKYRSELKKKEKPNVGLDKESFEQIMSLLDDIIIHP